mmetsp:Transcript_25733/g.57869  ORF Transcript_25733/g.57869 Transcript_25733/m.57869 type:complete len:527 (-) Transcript_25733:47-1627(-)
MVVGVDRLRRHVPSRSVSRRVGVGEEALEMELVPSQYVLEVLSPRDRQRRVVDPLVGVTDLHPELAHLHQRTSPRLLRHPLHLPQPLPQRLPHSLHHFQCRLLRLLLEVLGNVQLAQRLSQHRLQHGHGALPPGLLLLGALERLLEELEVLRHKRARQVERRERVQHVPLQVDAQPSRFLLPHRLADAHHGLQRRYVDLPQLLQRLADELEEAREPEAPGRRPLVDLRLQLLHRHLVVRPLRVPSIRPRHVEPGELLLHLEDDVRRLLCLHRRVVEEREHLCNVQLVRVALVLLVLVEVVVSVRKPQPRLVQLPDAPFTLLLVGALVEGQRSRVDSAQRELRDSSRQVLPDLVLRHRFKQRPERLCTSLLDRLLIHAARPEVCDFLLRPNAAFLGLELVHHVLEPLLVLLMQDGEAVPAGILRGDGVVLPPAADGEVVEVLVGCDELVEVRRIDALARLLARDAGAAGDGVGAVGAGPWVVAAGALGEASGFLHARTHLSCGLSREVGGGRHSKEEGEETCKAATS